MADRLAEAAGLLERQGANPFRVGAYRRAADTISGMSESITEIADSAGLEGLMQVPNIGHGIGAAIVEMVRSGRWSTLDRLRGEVDPIGVFQVLPEVGPVLAERLHDKLDVDSLEALEVAALDGRLERVRGIGPVRARIIRAALGRILGSGEYRRQSPGKLLPSVGEILDVDREYREKAADDKLVTIAPRRFNPDGKAWLPILHTERGGWILTALFSNSGRAHELGRTRDWVVIFHDDDHGREGQHTVVTERRGRLKGRRVVRGREAECRRLYDSEKHTLNDTRRER
ncbi:MAG: helix-hairpin-helix domain-containing protein [Thermoanaerobaculales bacterium]|nr:helix-hairpin-helix domain-containing protein [Thermoanaerobaculales bacterium]